jgi:hypothetical protein
MAENRPTDNASEYFKAGSASATRAVLLAAGKPQGIDVLTAHAVYCLAEGLGQLSVGLRATYIKLEQVEALLKRQR